MGDAGHGNVVLHVGKAVEEVAGLHVELREHGVELLVELLLRRLVRRRVGEGQPAVAVDGNPVFRPRQILGREPEVDRVLCDPLQRPVRRQLRFARLLAPEHRLL